jgi:hypothetical protein
MHVAAHMCAFQHHHSPTHRIDRPVCCPLYVGGPSLQSVCPGQVGSDDHGGRQQGGGGPQVAGHTHNGGARPGDLCVDDNKRRSITVMALFWEGQGARGLVILTQCMHILLGVMQACTLSVQRLCIMARNLVSAQLIYSDDQRAHGDAPSA